jgi:hypothetical protein
MAKAEAQAGRYHGAPGGMAVATSSPVRTALPSPRVHRLSKPEAMASETAADSTDTSQTLRASLPYRYVDQITRGARDKEHIHDTLAVVFQSWRYGG